MKKPSATECRLSSTSDPTSNGPTCFCLVPIECPRFFPRLTTPQAQIYYFLKKAR